MPENRLIGIRRLIALIALGHARKTTGTITTAQRMGPGRMKVTYEYREDSQTLTSSRLTPLPQFLGTAGADAFAPGSSVTVYIASSQGGATYLLPQGQAYPYLLIFGGVAVGLGAWRTLRYLGLFNPPAIKQNRS